MRLEKWQRNQLFEAIEAVGLDPGDFELVGDEAESRLDHRWSESYFTVGGAPGHYSGQRVVGDASPWPYEAYSWEALKRSLDVWLHEVKRDLETPDLWAELQSQREVLRFAPLRETENKPFTPDEQEEIATRLREIKEYVKETRALSASQLDDLGASLDYLEAAAGRLGRFDWRGLFVAVIVAYGLNVGLPPETARHILKPLVRGLFHLSGLLDWPSD